MRLTAVILTFALVFAGVAAAGGEQAGTAVANMAVVRGSDAEPVFSSDKRMEKRLVLGASARDSVAAAALAPAKPKEKKNGFAKHVKGKHVKVKGTVKHEKREAVKAAAAAVHPPPHAAAHKSKAKSKKHGKHGAKKAEHHAQPQPQPHQKLVRPQGHQAQPQAERPANDFAANTNAMWRRRGGEEGAVEGGMVRRGQHGGGEGGPAMDFDAQRNTAW